MRDYDTFLAAKQVTAHAVGFNPGGDLNLMLFEFQRDIVRWALRRGRAAIFADCGLGKTPMQLTWAHHVSEQSELPVLIVAPLAVSTQTVHEGAKFGYHVTHCRQQSDVRVGINITNYEMLPHFTASAFGGVVLDESSILKSHDGKTRQEIIDMFGRTPYRLACTATPAPNDYMELGNHSEFLGIMSRTEMLAMFFTHDGGDTSKWRLKGHAEAKYWEWLASWAVMIRNPSDLGYSDDGFVLPPMTIHHHVVERDNDDAQAQGLLFAVEAATLQERQQERRASIGDRVAETAALVNSTPGPWVVWCNLNNEGDALEQSIDGAVQVSGSDTREYKVKAIDDFVNGVTRVIVSKASIFGYGLNLQHCPNVAFVGLSDSFEQYYQAIRRCWRFGQENEVHCHIVTANTEGAVVANIERKERDAKRMAENMVAHMKDISSSLIKGATRDTMDYTKSIETGNGWSIRLGDCIEGVRSMPDDSIGYTIFSPPFASLYTYTNSDRDMGNSKNYDEFAEHFKFLVPELFRVTMPGRLLSFHCMNLPLSKERDGVIGIRDFRGELVRLFVEHGWVFHSEVTIWKDPVTAMQRTKAIGLLHKQLNKDSALSRQGIPDYLVTMRKPGVNTSPISGPLEYYTGDGYTVNACPNYDYGDKYTDADYEENPDLQPVIESRLADKKAHATRTSIDIWQRYASPVWMDINMSNTLNKQRAREDQDERHICPLQLDVIERAMQLWTMPNDLVYSPFTGIGSEGYVALKMGRRFIGDELKPSYWEVACENLTLAEKLSHAPTLFDFEEKDITNETCTV